MQDSTCPRPLPSLAAYASAHRCGVTPPDPAEDKVKERASLNLALLGLSSWLRLRSQCQGCEIEPRITLCAQLRVSLRSSPSPSAPPSHVLPCPLK